MLSWLGGMMIGRDMASLRRGDLRPLLRLDAEDVRFRFPGDSSFAAEIEGKEEHERWLRRFVEIGLQIYPDKVIVQGFPWRMTVCVRGTIHLDTPEAGRVYENRYVLWGRIAWGRLREYEVYEDTQRSKALDEYLSEELDQPPGNQ